jgi:2'-5' RNA ligase
MAETDRLFFALFPTAKIAAQISEFSQEFARKNQIRGRPIPPERLHVTLAFLGDFDGLTHPLIESAKRAAGRVFMAPFDCGFDRVETFKGRDHRRPQVLRSADNDSEEGGLAKLHQSLDQALAKEGLVAVQRRFTPHITLVYDDFQLDEPKSAGLYTWRVNDFVLVHSLIGRASYTPLARWRLTDDGTCQ